MNIREVVNNELKLNATDGLASPVKLASNPESEMAKALKANLESQRALHIQDVAVVATELLQRSEKARAQKIQMARDLRQQAKDLTEEATSLFNAESTLMEESRIAPLAYLLGECHGEQADKISKALAKKPLKDYWKEAKKSVKPVDGE
jgi:hypothetical protein